MISVILYGRNDAHGYNLHRRAGLSLNCIAEVLTDPDDEIVFVDYNTPDELPTFVEALADTLTESCIARLRVLRVPAAVHERRFAALTHLPAIEPIARNAGIRRANPANRWLLSTNTDMIFLPQARISLSEICRDIADGFYGLPRFELPEWLWERLPRTDPKRAMAEIERFGTGLRLDEPTVSHEWIRFDAPGDFQLVLREDFVAVDGFDEEMLLGYHVDSNFSRRMLLHRGSIESLGDSLAGYHCNHNRERTVYHGAQIVVNDLKRFVVDVERADLPAQRDTWGLFDDEVEEVAVSERLGPRFAESLARAIPRMPGPRAPSDAARVPYEPTYDSGHVLPFVPDALAVSSSHARVGYVGANPVLERMLAAAVADLWFENPLETARLGELSAAEELVSRSDIIVVDLGIDVSAVDSALTPQRENQPARLPRELHAVSDVLERLVSLERARLDRGERATRFVLVHSWTVFWDAFVLANFDCSHTTAHSRVRRATVRPVPAEDAGTRRALARERVLFRWATRGEAGRQRLSVPGRGALELGRIRDYAGFGDGWAFPEETGIWTQGRRSKLALAVEGGDNADRVLALSLGSICVAPESSLGVAAVVNGERVADRQFKWGDPSWHLELPRAAAANGVVDLTFEIDNPSTPIEAGWSRDDERPLGLQLRGIKLLSADDAEARAGLERERRIRGWAARRHGDRLHIRPGQTVELADSSQYAGFHDGWTLYPDQAGVWTDGLRSDLALALDEIRERDHAIVLGLESICVDPDDLLGVEALVNGERVEARDLAQGDTEWRVELPTHVRADGAVDLTLAITAPRSPHELGWSDDERPLGVLVRSLTLEEVDRSVPLGEEIEFNEGSGAERLLGDGWSVLEPTGVWTDGEKASLVLEVEGASSGDVELLLTVDPFLTPGRRELRVDVYAGGERLASRVFRSRRFLRFGRRHEPLRVVLPAARRDERGRVIVELEIDQPARPLDLGVSEDSRQLGLHLRSLVASRV